MDAVVLGAEYEFSKYSRDTMIYTKEMLLVPPPEKRAAEPEPKGRTVPLGGRRL